MTRSRTLLSLGLVMAGLGATPILDACSSTKPASESLSDSTITAKVKAKYVADPEINPFNISVETNEGVVYLTGRVKTQEQKDEAEELAAHTDGVTDVVNHLLVGDKTE